jgi:hypothetical protein
VRGGRRYHHNAGDLLIWGGELAAGAVVLAARRWAELACAGRLRSAAVGEHRAGAAIRVSDAYRQDTVDRLDAALREERLGAQEHGERVRAARVARLPADLSALLADLVAPVPPDRVVPDPVPPREAEPPVPPPDVAQPRRRRWWRR